jgi:UDP-2,4-diacetamido-2,4,6-trideoxy-beta-L-altropyranose hydrolase
MKIAFVTDGGLEMGMGHVQQSTTLAKELMDRAEICFLTKSDDIVVKQIVGCGFKTFKLNNDNEIADLLHEINPNVVIIDKLDVDEALSKKLRDTLSAKLVIFSNMTTANVHADIAVCADFGSNFKNLRFRNEKTSTLYFCGPRYWILRREFYELHKKGKTIPGKVENILLIFGGSDPSNLTSTVLEQLLKLGHDYKIDVILGAHFGYPDAFNRVLSEHQKRELVNVYSDIRNVAQLMYEADLVIASPGLSAFEALCVGTPVIIIPQNSLQREIYKAHIATLEKSDIARLGNMIESGDFVDPRDAKIADLDIGQGISELVEAIIDSR